MNIDLWIEVGEYGEETKQHCYISSGSGSINSGSVQSEM